jgi:hypothetical protein
VSKLRPGLKEVWGEYKKGSYVVSGRLHYWKLSSVPEASWRCTYCDLVLSGDTLYEVMKITHNSLPLTPDACREAGIPACLSPLEIAAAEAIGGRQMNLDLLSTGLNQITEFPGGCPCGCGATRVEQCWYDSELAACCVCGARDCDVCIITSSPRRNFPVCNSCHADKDRMSAAYDFVDTWQKMSPLERAAAKAQEQRRQ